MKIPGIFHGDYKHVLANVRALALSFIEGSPADSFLESRLDSHTTSGLFVLDEPKGKVRQGPHFFCGALAIQLNHLFDVRKPYGDAVWERFYDWALAEPGTFLTVLGQFATVPFLHRQPLYQKLFVEAGLRYWEEYSAEGKRYLVRGWHPEALWSIPNGIKGSMVALSGRNDWVLDPLPPGGLAQLVKELKLPVSVRAN